jgi:NADP-dependent 3-hydroxy acid dehydrogenase YdfG
MNYKKALISGASAGFGEASAFRLASEGLNLILLARRGERLIKIKAELERLYKVDVAIVVADISKTHQLEAAFKKIDLEGVDVLINNAGLAKGTAKLQEGDLSDWDAMIDTNVKGLLALSRLLLPIFIKKNHGHIINIGSVAGRWVYPGGGVYCATKFAVRALSEGLRMDLSGTSIRVTNVEPGMAETEFSRVRLKDETKARAVYQGMTPLKPEDIADCIAWTLSRPAHVNIQEMVIFPTDQASVTQVTRK